MIVVDASAVVAILLEEPDGPKLKAKLEAAPELIMSPINLWEAIVRLRTVAGEDAVRAMDSLFLKLGMQIATIGAAEAREAATAYTRFGRRATAGLNLGDCFAYALAKARGAPLLYKGDDFARTDVASA